jgi:hypothetical protein
VDACKGLHQHCHAAQVAGLQRSMLAGAALAVVLVTWEGGAWSWAQGQEG